MIKLKLNREQLYALCTFTNPATYESFVQRAIKKQDIKDLDRLFNIVQIGESLAKKWLFTNQKAYYISFKYSEAASLLKTLILLEWDHDKDSYEYNLIIILKQFIHQQITNIKPKYHGETDRQRILSPGDQGAGATPARLA